MLTIFSMDFVFLNHQPTNRDIISIINYECVNVKSCLDVTVHGLKSAARWTFFVCEKHRQPNSNLNITNREFIMFVVLYSNAPTIRNCNDFIVLS